MESLGVHLVDKQHAVEVVDLVLNNSGLEPLQLELDVSPLSVGGMDLDCVRPLHISVQAGNAKTAFLPTPIPS